MLQKNYTDIVQCVNDLNKMRLSAKNKWLYCSTSFNNVPFHLKSFNTWIQRIKIKNIISDDLSSDISVNDYKKYSNDFIIQNCTIENYNKLSKGV